MRKRRDNGRDERNSLVLLLLVLIFIGVGLVVTEHYAHVDGHYCVD